MCVFRSKDPPSWFRVLAGKCKSTLCCNVMWLACDIHVYIKCTWCKVKSVPPFVYIISSVKVPCTCTVLSYSTSKKTFCYVHKTHHVDPSMAIYMWCIDNFTYETPAIMKKLTTGLTYLSSTIAKDIKLYSAMEW